MEDSPQTQIEYEAILIPALTYGSESWAMKVTNKKKKNATTEIRMLHGILGVSRRVHMRNEEIRRILQFALSSLV